MKPTLEIASSSVKNPAKAKNGDYCSHLHLEKENLTILVLSDGVGGSPCDWKASEKSCSLFLSIFGLQSDLKDIRDRIDLTIKQVNSEVLYEAEPCDGMKSTLSILIWDLNKNEIHYSNIGDSRIYEFSNNKLTQISEDDSSREIVRQKDGKLLISDQALVISEGISNCIGSQELGIATTCIKADSTRGIVLASDGFYNAKSSFSSDMIESLESLSMNFSLENLSKEYKDYQKDDMTVLICRRRGEYSKQIIDSVLSDKEVSSWSNLEIRQSIIVELQSVIKQKEDISANALLDYCEESDLELGKTNTGSLISLMQEVDYQNMEVYTKLVHQLRRSKF